MKHKVNVKGVIVSNDDQWIYDMFEMESTSPKNISEAIGTANGADLEVVINSGGGSVFDGSEIYTELKEYPGNVEIKVVGLAASAASVIAMAGNKVRISPTAQMMIHNAAMVARGDYRDMDKASTMLSGVNKAVSSAYRLKSGMEESELLELMNNETWLNPQDALDKGLVDEIMFEDNSVKLAASATVTNTIPQEVIEGVRNNLLKDKQPGGINKEMLDNALSAMKTEIINELKQNNEPPKPEPTNKISKLFLNLK